MSTDERSGSRSENARAGHAGLHGPDLLPQRLAEAHERPRATFAKEHGLACGMGTNSTQRVLRVIRGQRVSIEMGFSLETARPPSPRSRCANLRLPAGFGLRRTPRIRRGAPPDRGQGADDQIQNQGTNRDQIVSMLTQPVLRDHLVAFYEVRPHTIIENNSVTAGGPVCSRATWAHRCPP